MDGDGFIEDLDIDTHVARRSIRNEFFVDLWAL